MVEALAGDVSPLSSKLDTLSGSVSSLAGKLSEEFAALRGSITTLIAIDAVCLLLLVVTVVVLLTRKPVVRPAEEVKEVKPIGK